MFEEESEKDLEEAEEVSTKKKKKTQDFDVKLRESIRDKTKRDKKVRE